MDYKDSRDYQGSRVDFSSNIMSRIFSWMGVGLAITGVIAYFLGHAPAFINFIRLHPYALLGVILVQLLVVIGLSFGINRLSYPAALMLFFLYAALTGVTFSTLFLAYQESSIALTFFITAGMFGSMALYGAVTKHDLTSIGSMLGMAVWGLVIAMVANMYFKSTMFEMAISFVGVLIFAGLTAYDVQKLRALSGNLQTADESLTGKVAVMGALTLYLDFINLFLFLLNLFGKRKES